MKRSKLNIIKSVVEEKQYTKISMLLGTTRKRVILDVTTARALLNMFNRAPIENHSKINKLGWDRLCNLAWG